MTATDLPAMPLDADAAIRGIAGLPSLPATVLEILQCLNDDDIDTDTLAHKIAADQALVARMLRVANSPFYGLRGRVNSIQDAIVVLGLRSVRMLASAAAVAHALKRLSTPEFSYASFLRHSVATALGARLLAKRCRQHEEIAFLAGLLHDIGRLALASCFPAHFAAVRRYRDQTDCQLLDAERLVLGLDHARLGHLLAEHWGFPPALCEAIGSHHGCEDEALTLGNLVQVADAIVHALDLAEDDTEMAPRIAPCCWSNVGLAWHDSQALFQEIERQFADLGDLLAG